MNMKRRCMFHASWNALARAADDLSGSGFLMPERKLQLRATSTQTVASTRRALIDLIGLPREDQEYLPKLSLLAAEEATGRATLAATVKSA
jgi:hypothetical protein